MTNSPSFPPLFPGMLLDAAARFAQDNATTDLRASHTVRDMGWACTLVPEDAGGVGGSFADLAAVIEGLATHGVQLPVIETCAVAPILLQAAAPEVAARWLQAVAEGSAVAAPLAALSAPLCEVTLTAQPLDIGYALHGTLLHIAHTHHHAAHFGLVRDVGRHDLQHHGKSDVLRGGQRVQPGRGGGLAQHRQAGVRQHGLGRCFAGKGFGAQGLHRRGRRPIAGSGRALQPAGLHQRRQRGAGRVYALHRGVAHGIELLRHLARRAAAQQDQPPGVGLAHLLQRGQEHIAQARHVECVG